ncbi:Vicilin-like antimicrobial peptides 2-1 [Platanthera zijinensis]|uniref:Vicilin-like antimicrobial peptides 2-1 n=1 Tax=Platanthera zijinensis TaxID=2320716 RepID=A0AAP0GAT7_9ASPA
MPTHLDAHSVFYVIEGEGAIFILHEGSRESHSLERGDIIRVWSGSIFYLINKSHDRKLRIVKLLQTVGTNPGGVEAFYSAGGEEADSYYQSFSIELLEAALNTRRDKLQRFFAQHAKEGIIKASEEKIRAIAPFAKSKKPFNLLRKRPSHQNNRGQAHEADSNDYEQLKNLNARVSHANVSGGSMVAAFFNTRAFRIALVEQGSGYLEIICPHVEGQRGGEGSTKYARVSSVLSEGSVYVIPPGHPASIVAGRGKNLQIMCFEMPAENNELVFLAGKNNILREMEDTAKELAFGVPAKGVDEVLGGQKGEVFLPGPEEWREEIRGHGDLPLEYSVLEVSAGF